MFDVAIKHLASEEQKTYWNPLTRRLKIIGCYAQTELGHGSDVAGMETTATFDRNTDEFIINSPTPTSTKYWPGDLGLFSSHALIMARLLIDGRDFGT